MAKTARSGDVDRHRFNADPDPNFHVDADPDQDPDPVRHQNNTDPHADPTPSFTHVGKSEFLFHQCKICHLVLVFGQQIENCSKKVYFYEIFVCLELIPIRIRQNDADPTRSRSRSESGNTTMEKFHLPRYEFEIRVCTMYNVVSLLHSSFLSKEAASATTR